MLHPMFKKHEFTFWSIFYSDGRPSKCTNTSAFHTGMVTLLTRILHKFRATADESLVIDSMGLVNQLRIHDDVDTLADLASQFVTTTCSYLQSMYSKFGYEEDDKVEILVTKTRPCSTHPRSVQTPSKA